MDTIVARWMDSVSRVERCDPAWGLHAYRVARYALHLASGDVRDLVPSRRQHGDQLIRSVASISASIGDGCSRPSTAERSRFFAYALGSTHEAVAWYVTIEDVVGVDVVVVRAAILSRVRRLTFGMLRAARNRQRVAGTKHLRIPPACLTP